jgi:hypothetical protein
VSPEPVDEAPPDPLGVLVEGGAEDPAPELREVSVELLETGGEMLAGLRGVVHVFSRRKVAADPGGLLFFLSE